MIFEAILINYQVPNVYIFSYIQSIKPSNRTSVKAHQKYKKKFIRPIISQKINIYICTFNSCVSFLHSYKYAQPKPPLPLSNPSPLLYPTPPAWAGKHCSHCIPAPSSRDKKQKKAIHLNSTLCSAFTPQPHRHFLRNSSATPKRHHLVPNQCKNIRQPQKYAPGGTHTTKHTRNLQKTNKIPH